MTDRITEVLGALIASLEGKAKNSCPIATRDVSVNLKNRQKAIDVAEYGPLNPEEPNEKYWKKLADIWDVSTTDAKKQRCGNCAAFIQTSKMKKCIEDGLAKGDTKENAWDTIKAGDLGYCEAFDFKCASSRTCSAWITGGPITDKNKPEEKVRRVRTPEGVDKYNQPIGSVIRPDYVPDVREMAAIPTAKKPTGKPKTNTRKSKKVAPPEFDIPFFKIKHSRDKSSGSVVHTYTAKDPKNKRTIIVTGGGDRWKMSEITKDNKTEVIKDIFARNKETIYLEMERELKRPYIEKAYEEYAGAKPSHENFFDVFQGVYGIEWVNEDEDQIDETDIEQRWMAIEKEKMDLGIDIKKSSPNSQYEVHYEAQESINVVARAMEDLFPGFSAYQPIYALDTVPKGNALAYNVHAGEPFFKLGAQYQKRYLPYVDDNIEWDYAGVGLDKAVFGDDFEPWKLERLYIQDPKWWSVNNTQVAIDKNLEKWESLFFGILLHETGHTVARIAMGDLAGRKSNKEDRKKAFVENMLTIFRKYGILVENKDSDIPDNPRFVTLDKSYVSKLLSTYGTDSLHEFLAESWAEYMYSPSPRPLATEVGNMLADALDDFLEKEYEEE